MPLFLNPNSRSQYAARAAFSSFDSFDGLLPEHVHLSAARVMPHPDELFRQSRQKIDEAAGLTVAAFRSAKMYAEGLAHFDTQARAAPTDQQRASNSAQYRKVVGLLGPALVTAIDQRVRVARAKTAALWSAMASKAKDKGLNELAGHLQGLAVAALGTPVATGSQEKVLDFLGVLLERANLHDALPSGAQQLGPELPFENKSAEFTASVGLPLSTEEGRPQAFDPRFIETVGDMLRQKSSISKAENVVQSVMSDNPVLRGAMSHATRFSAQVKAMIGASTDDGTSGIVGEDLGEYYGDQFGGVAVDLVDEGGMGDLRELGDFLDDVGSFFGDAASAAVDVAKKVIPGGTIFGKVINGDIAGATSATIAEIAKATRPAPGAPPPPPPPPNLIGDLLKSAHAQLSGTGSMQVLMLGAVALGAWILLRGSGDGDRARRSRT